jgi:Tfp pilus assembly protein FimT
MPANSTARSVYHMERLNIVNRSRNLGFTTLELTVVVLLGLIITVMGLPSLSKTQAAYRASGDGRGIAETLALAKMRAGTNFTKERVTFDSAANTYQLERYNKANDAFELDGGVKYLSSGVSFGFAGITLPAGGQTTITQTSPMAFNSRGIPINGSNQPTGDGAIYYYNTTGYFAVTVGLSSRVQTWKYANSAWVAQ